MILVKCNTKDDLQKMDWITSSKFGFSQPHPPLYVDPNKGNIIPIDKLEKNKNILIMSIKEYYANQSITFINLTDHEIHDIESDITIPPSGTVLRISYETELCNHLNGINVYCTKATIDNIPPRLPNTYYLVSNLAINYIPDDRDDFLCPGNVVRGKDGKPIGCVGLRSKTIYPK